MSQKSTGVFHQAFAVLQQVGKALMLPVALLPAAGILLAFGNMFQNPQFLNSVPFLDVAWFQKFAVVMEQSGGIIFANLALIFAVGVAVGLSDGDGVAGLAAIVGFLIMNKTMGVLGGVTAEQLADPSYTSVLGIPTLQTGVFGGIIVGILASYAYKKYFNIVLPSYLGFFAGKRFVPIVTAVYALALGIILLFVWPPIQYGLTSFSSNMIDTNKTVAAFVFGVIERSLIPFGLHHIFYNPFWYQFGEYIDSSGTMVNGDQQIFFAQLRDGAPFTAGTFMTGKFPFMMFGLPAAALAIYHEARPEKKVLVGGILASAALTSFLTGITEPIEFLFLFVAPVLFGIHCVFAGLSFMIMHILNIKIGMTFSGGFIDFMLFGVIPNRTTWWLVIPVGLAFSAIYYFGFRYAIRKWDLKTPGRELDSEESVEAAVVEESELALEVLKALGGSENIDKLDACITRLRVVVNNSKNVDKNQLKALGASGVMEVGSSIQAIFGPKSDQLKNAMKDVMAGKTPAAVSVQEKSDSKDVSYSIDLSDFASPLDGKMVALSEVPDDMFANKILGDGFAIIPTNGDIVSPVNGTATTILPSKHAVGLISDKGHEVLVHFGIDTVTLKGDGFEAFVEPNDTVETGTPILKVDIDKVQPKVPSIITPVIFLNLPDGKKISFESGKQVKKGQTNIVTLK